MKHLFIALILSLAGATAASAADFTFNIPLRVENVPSMETVTVKCLVSSVRVGEPYAAGRGNVVGQGQTTVRPVDGGYNGVVRVEVNASGINPASSAQSYSCNLSASGAATTGATYAASPGNFADVYERATGHTLDRTTLSTRANF